LQFCLFLTGKIILVDEEYVFTTMRKIQQAFLSSRSILLILHYKAAMML